MRTRIAPTPSGFIHLGNAFNFKLIGEYAEKHNCEIHLRIDDFDKDRVRVPYIEDIFHSLKWLHIKISHGPTNLSDFEKNYSIQLKQEKYWKIAKKLFDEGFAYACDCSRSQKDRFNTTGAYLGHCRHRKLNFNRGLTALRLKCPENFALNWQHSLNDFVLWTKENFAAYQLISTVEDTELGTSVIIRGSDLADSSEAQCYLASHMGEQEKEVFGKIKFFHHELIVDPKNPQQKYSKSEGAHSLKKLIADGYTYNKFLKDYDAFKNQFAQGIL